MNKGPWYWCLVHHQVEPKEGCANDRRMGPYETPDLAETALERAAERTAAWDAEDAAEADWDDDQ